MSEVLFQSGDITVTRSVAKFGNSTYPIANIGSVVIEDEANSLSGWILLLGIGVGIWAGISSHWIMGVVIAGVALFLGIKVPTKKKLTLKTSSGDVTALSSGDTNLVESVRLAIENAFTR